jgi:hypothetical protein
MDAPAQTDAGPSMLPGWYGPSSRPSEWQVRGVVEGTWAIIVTCYATAPLLCYRAGPIGNHGDGSTSLDRGWRLAGSLLAAACPDATDIQGAAGA